MIKAKAPTIKDLIDASSHNIETSDNRLRCKDCVGSVCRTSPKLRNWLKAKCLALPYDDSIQLVPIHTWYVVQIGNNIPHSSHILYSYKGIVCCDACGAFGAKRCRLLAQQCEGHCTVSTERARNNLKLGQLPVPNMVWPRKPSLGLWQPAPEHIPVRACTDSTSLAISTLDDPDIWFDDFSQ